MDLNNYPVSFAALASAVEENSVIYYYTYVLGSGNATTNTILVNVVYGSTSGAQSHPYYLTTSGTWASAPSNWSSYAKPLLKRVR